MSEETTRLLGGATETAIKTLTEIAGDTEQHPGLRIEASREIIKYFSIHSTKD